MSPATSSRAGPVPGRTMSDAATHVLTLIAAPGAPLEADHVAAAAAAIAAAGGRLGTPVWLAPGQACDLGLAGIAAAPAEAAARGALAASGPFDLAVLPTRGRRKRLLLADMDSTIITCECIDELADFAGLRAEVAAITERAMRGELEFEAALRARVALLKDMPLALLERAYAERVRLAPGARVLVQTMRRHGAVTALVSGGFTFFTARVAAACGFAHHFGNDLLHDGRRLTGEVGAPILGRAAKLETLRRLRAAHGLAVTETLAVGDGANDLGMIAEAGLGVAFHAKPVVAEAAAVRINHADLTALLFLQGYRASEFAPS